MNLEILTALCTFAFVSSVTPGPNNLMLMTSGANFGIWRTIPHFLGVVLGFVLMVLLVGTGQIGRAHV
jgi:threonine/homoserine/homoserine lactone efflux protein